MNEKKTIQGNTDIQGSVNISRHITAGGNGDIQGCVRVGHNLKVEGWLDAKNIKGPLKGLYANEGALTAAYPRPQAGWFALVGDTLPAAVYRAELGDDGKIRWSATGDSGGEFSIYLDALESDVGQVRDEMLEVMDKAEVIDEIAQSVEDITARLKKDLQGEMDLSSLGNVSERHTTSQLPSVWRVVSGDYSVGVLIRYSDPYGHSVAEEIHTMMKPGESGCLVASALDGPARVYTRTWCREKKTWTPWEESPRAEHVEAKADRSMFVTLSEEEYDALAIKDPETYYYIYEDED